METLIKDIANVLKAAGKYQIDMQFQSFQSSGKGENEFVSEIDKQSEILICERLQKIVPEAGFYGEELGKSGNQELRWIVDPIDGTTNYLAGLDYFSISVALYEGKTPLLATVYRPSSGFLWSASQETELCLNNQKIEVTRFNQKSLKDSLVCTGFPYRSKDLRAPFSKAIDYSLDVSRGVRRFGSAALDLSLMSSGRFGAFFETDLKSYDIASGLLFLEKAGFKTLSEKSKTFDMEEDRLLIATYPHELEIYANKVSQIYKPFL